MKIIFESLLTTFETNGILGNSWGNSENWFKPKTNPPSS